MDELTRFFMTNAFAKSESGDFEQNSLKDWNKQIQEMTKALESATNGIVKVTKSLDAQGKAMATFDVARNQAGNAQAVFERLLSDFEKRYGFQNNSLKSDPYNNGIPMNSNYRNIEFNKVLHGSVAQQTAKEILKELGGSISPNPSRQSPDRQKITFPVSEADYSSAVQARGNEYSARGSLISAFTEKHLSPAIKFSNDVQDRKRDKEREKELDKKQKEQDRLEVQEKKENQRHIKHTLLAVLGVITGIADTARRILTASLARGSEMKQEQTEAKNLGISHKSFREYKAQEKVMGLREGIFTSGISALQAGTGDISNLDENMIRELAKVLKGDVIVPIQNGLGASDPEKAMQLILDAYYQRGQQGINSLGMNVGQYQAQRELATALEKAGLADFAEILRNMFYTNDTGIYHKRIDRDNAFNTYMGLSNANTMGFIEADQKHFAELGQVVDSLKNSFSLLKENLEKLVLHGIGGLLDKINNWNIGMSAEEKLLKKEENRRLNARARERIVAEQQMVLSDMSKSLNEAGISISEMGYDDVSSFASAFSDRNKREKMFRNSKFKRFANTKEGEAFLDYVSVYLADKEAIDKTLKKPEEYLASLYTPSGMSVSASKHKGEILSTMSIGRYNYNANLQALERYLKGENGEERLKAIRNSEEYQNKFKNSKFLNKGEELLAIANNAFGSFGAKDGWGFSSDMKLIRQANLDKAKDIAQDAYNVQYIKNELLQSPQFAELNKKLVANNSRIISGSMSYDGKQRKAVITLRTIDSRGKIKEEPLYLNTDGTLEKEYNFNIKTDASGAIMKDSYGG